MTASQRPQKPAFDVFVPKDAMTPGDILDSNSVNPEFEFVGGVLSHLTNITLGFKSQKIAREFLAGCQQARRSIPNAHTGSVNFVPLEPQAGKDFMLSVESTTIKGTPEVGGKTCDLSAAGVRVFQRMQRATGLINEIRYYLTGSTFMDVDSLLEIASPEFPNADLDAAIEWLVEFNKTNRAKWSKHLAEQPPKIDPRTASVEILAEGFTTALKRLGMTQPQAAK